MYRSWSDVTNNVNYGFEKKSEKLKVFNSVEYTNFNFGKNTKRSKKFIY